MALIDEQICKVMAEIGAVGKNETNQIQKYKFRGIDAVMNALHPAMVKNHVFVTPEVLSYEREERPASKGGILIYSIVTVKYHFFTDDGSEVTAVVMGEAMDSGDKSMNKAMSAAFKYACFQTFCIPTEEMKDSEQDSPEPAYPSKDEMIALIEKKNENDPENMKKILAFLKVEALKYATEAQIMTVYNRTLKRK